MCENDRFTTSDRVIATELRRLLDDRGIKHAWVARQVGLSKPQFSGVLSKKRTIAADTAMQICEVIGVPFSLAFEFANAKDAAA